MTTPTGIFELVERFNRNRDAYLSGAYNETQLRREFVDPLFEVLGWDVFNKLGYAEAYKDVIHEDAIKIGGFTKAPDYCFRIGGTRKFFVEAKKPSINIKEDISPAFQLRRYAWSAKLPLSILTDFEEFAVYDCRVKPVKTDKASTARILYVTYDKYPEKWDDITPVFSRDAILKGSFDKYVETTKGKKGTAEVDDAFLKEIETWRDILAHNIAIRNPRLSQRDLNFAVQAVIDRIIFLRICEDRGIEEYGRLLALLNGTGVYARLFELFQRADERYNSGLFHFRDEKARQESADLLTPTLALDDKPLKEIVKNLYYPDSAYEFSVLPADILGQVYEQFLGKVIRLTAGHRAVVEDKPEVKKAGGVYYTPTYIVDYIVGNTVGKLVEGKTPKQVSKLRILDPACGSGSFLISAYQCLLDWYRDRYVEEGTDKHTKVLYQGPGGAWRLTTAERKRILLNNIYGVDIDPQAVEVTKLSLLLKVLEGESDETLSKQLKLFHERALPDLSDNIKCGNSLVGPDFYNNEQMTLLNEDECYRINAFDWNAEFPETMKVGGFDVVIGNPPYGFHQIHSGYIKPYFKNKYVSSGGSFEHYFLFYELSLRLLAKKGMHGFIVPVTWLTIPSAKSLRRFVLDGYYIEKILWLPEFVFRNAKVNTLVSIISKKARGQTEVSIFDVLDLSKPPAEVRNYEQAKFVDDDYYIGIFESQRDESIITKMLSNSKPLASYTKPCSGYNPYEVGKGEAPDGGPQTKVTVEEKPYHADNKLGAAWKLAIVGRDLGRYSLEVDGKRWIKYGPWLAAARAPDNFTGRRILVQEITGGSEHRIVATFYEGELYHSRDVIPIKILMDTPHPYYLLGIINSRLMTWYHHRRNPKANKGLFPKVLVSDLKKLPIHQINQDDEYEIKIHDKLVTLVTRMLTLNHELEGMISGTPVQRDVLRRRVNATDKQIDQLVYELYGLSDDEIQIVEKGVSG